MKTTQVQSEQFLSLKINALALMQVLSSRSLVAQDIQCLDSQSKKLLCELLLSATIEEHNHCAESA